MTNTALFVNGKDMYWLSRSRSTNVDYEQMLNEFSQDYGELDESNYYAVIPSSEPESLHQLLTFLKHNGYNVNTAKSRSQQDTVSIDPKIAADVVSYAASHNDPTIILAATSVTLTPVVRAAQQWGARVILATSQDKVDVRLMNAVNEVYDLKKLDTNAA